MTSVLVVQAAAFKKCCMQSGDYDGSRRSYFFPRIEQRADSGQRPMRLGMQMYLRFVVATIDEDSERALGVFHAVWNLRDSGKLHAYEEDQHDVVRWWFSANLERPTRFTAAKAPYSRNKKNRALSWFKDTATD